MNEETKDFLLECKKAGYEFVAIGVVDKRVPISCEIEKYGERKYRAISGSPLVPSGGEYWGETWMIQNGEKIITKQASCVCAAPNQRKSGFPALWKICEKSNLTAGLRFRGVGYGESHQIRRNHNLESGCYDLNKFD